MTLDKRSFYGFVSKCDSLVVGCKLFGLIVAQTSRFKSGA